jgi:hypothetical protein
LLRFGKPAYAAGVGKRGVGALVAGFVALGACATSPTKSDSTAPTPVGARTSTSRVTPTTPTPATTRTPTHTATTARPAPARPTPAFSFDDSVPPPKIVDTGTDYVAVLTSFRLYCNWLAAYRPDPALLSLIDVPGRTHEGFATDLEWYRANRRRAIEVMRGSVRFTIVSTRPDAFSAKSVEDIAAHQEVDANGVVTSDIRYRAPTTYLWLAVRVSGKWRLASIAVQQPVDVHL